MSERLDGDILRLFSEAEEDLSDGLFLQQVEQRIARRHRRTMLTRFAIVAAVIALEFVLDSPIRHSITGLSEALSTTLYETENQWVDYFLSPINSIAGILGALLVGAHVLHRRLRG